MIRLFGKNIIFLEIYHFDIRKLFPLNKSYLFLKVQSPMDRKAHQIEFITQKLHKLQLSLSFTQSSLQSLNHSLRFLTMKFKSLILWKMSVFLLLALVSLYFRKFASRKCLGMANYTFPAYHQFSWCNLRVLISSKDELWKYLGS
jgi:hypothetical protein